MKRIILLGCEAATLLAIGVMFWLSIFNGQVLP